MSTAARRTALRALLPAALVDALLVTDLVNVRYLTGFTGSNAALVVPATGDALLVTDSRYTTQAAAEAPDLEIVTDRAVAHRAATLAAERGAAVLGYESGHLSVDAHAALVAAAGSAGLRRAPDLVEGLRAVKDDAEVAALRRACAAADAALTDALDAGTVAAGRSELDVALDLERRMRGHGADGPAFETIVGAGAHAAIPHHRPTGAVLRRGDLVVMDFGALVDGYHSDTTRTVVVGQPAAWQREIHAVVAAAQAAGRAALTPGADVRDVDAAARVVIADAGYGGSYGHGLGHGIGLRIHEAPGLGPSGTGALAAGMALTVEPGIYLVDRGGVRIEDSLVVTAREPLLLTTTPRALTEV